MAPGRRRKPAFGAGRAASFPEIVTLGEGGRAVPLRVRRNARARRVVLRVDAARDEAVLTLPARVPLDEGLEFVRARGDWLAARLALLPPRVSFEDGAAVPLMGVPHVIRHAAKRARGDLNSDRMRDRGVVRIENGAIVVAGRSEHLPRRLADWLRAEAKRVLEPIVRDKAARLGLSIRRVTVRDTRTLWGSCSANGDVSLCWRLILAPPLVADYVCAHEAAHLVVRGHGARFWRLVEELADDMTAARHWLAREGETLQRYGTPIKTAEFLEDEQRDSEADQNNRARPRKRLGTRLAELLGGMGRGKP